MGNDDEGGVEGGPERGLDFGIRRGIEGSAGLYEGNQDSLFCIAEHLPSRQRIFRLRCLTTSICGGAPLDTTDQVSPRQCQQLQLAARECAGGAHMIQTVGQPGHKVLALRHLERSPDLDIAMQSFRVDVKAELESEEGGLLRDDSWSWSGERRLVCGATHTWPTADRRDQAWRCLARRFGCCRSAQCRPSGTGSTECCSCLRPSGRRCPPSCREALQS
jgi:hypothetical protein